MAAAALGLGLLPLTSASPAGAASDQSTSYIDRTLRVLEGEAPAETVADLADRLDGGTSRRTIVGERVVGQAYLDAAVADIYDEILGREPSIEDTAYWSQRISALGEYRARAELLSSSEFFASLGGTKEAFVDGVYRYGLDRPAEPAGVTYWVGRTGNTASSRSQVAWWVLRSGEGRTIVARDLFEEILARTPDAGSRDYFADRLRTARSIEAVTVDLAASVEAFTEAQKSDSLLVLTEGNTVATVDAETLVGTTEVTFAATGATPQLGIRAATHLVAIDVRPHTQVLYGLGSDGQLYSLNVDNGTASKIGSPIVAVAGDVVGFDFNPVVDRIRITTGGGENYRVNPDSGLVAAIDGPLAYAPGDPNAGQMPNVTGAAYSNSLRGELGTALPMSTVLYDIDLGVKALVTQAPPNDGVLNTVGSGLGLDDIDDAASGFDISPDTGRAIAVFSADGSLGSFRIDLTSGRAIRQSAVTLDGDVLGIAIAPEASTASGQGWALSSAGAVHTVTAVDLAAPGTAAATLTITGVNEATTLVGLDVRSATGMPYVLGDDGQLYVLGAPKVATPTVVPAEKVGVAPIAMANLDPAGLDFNPAVDRLRILGGTTNLRANPNNGTLADGDPVLPGVQPDGTLAYAEGDMSAMVEPNVVAGAYSNAVRGGVSTATQLFDLEQSVGALVLQDPPNAGTLNSRGGLLGFSVSDDAALDIQTGSGTAFAVSSDSGAVTLYTVNLSSGAALSVGVLPAGLALAGFTTT